MKKLIPKTISEDLISVQPMSAPSVMSKEEFDRINSEVKKENRDGKINALIEGRYFKEMKPEDHPDWKNLSLFYLDYTYDHTKLKS